MKSTGYRRLLLPLLFTGLVFASLSGAQASAQGNEAGKAAVSGPKVTLEGVVLKRDADTLTVRDTQGKSVIVALSNSTQVKERKVNPFRGGKNYAMTQLVRGLNVEVVGRQNSAGQIVAEEIKLKDDDLRFASSVETRVDPIETKLVEVEAKMVQSEQNAQRMSGQIDEVSSIAKAARSAAKAAQDTGDQANAAARDAARQGMEAANAAGATARAANERISALDDFDVKTTTIVLFALDSSTLGKDAQAELDSLAASAKNEKGYMLEITGFASSDGDPAVNERLSQRRADAVVRYLTENHQIPLRRLVTPFGFGAKNPVADNATRDGRKQNRRVEVKLLVNKALGTQIGK